MWSMNFPVGVSRELEWDTIGRIGGKTVNLL